MKEKRIWVQVAKNFEPIIKLTEEDIQKELFDFDEPIILNASDLGQGKHKVSAEVFASWNKHAYVDKNEEKTHSEEIEIVDSLPSSTLMNKNLLSLKISVTPPSLSGSSTSNSGCPNKPSYFAMTSFEISYLYPN